MCQLSFTLSLNPKEVGFNASEEMDFPVRVSLNGQREKKVSSWSLHTHSTTAFLSEYLASSSSHFEVTLPNLKGEILDLI